MLENVVSRPKQWTFTNLPSGVLHGRDVSSKSVHPKTLSAVGRRHLPVFSAQLGPSGRRRWPCGGLDFEGLLQLQLQLLLLRLFGDCRVPLQESVLAMSRAGIDRRVLLLHEDRRLVTPQESAPRRWQTVLETLGILKACARRPVRVA